MIVFFIGLVVLAIIVILDIKKKIVDQKETIVEYYNEDLEFLKYVNTHRKALNLKTLKPILSLDVRAKETVENFPPVDRHYNSLEIVGGGHQTLYALFKHYLKSDGHRANIEYEDYTYVGIGIKKVDGKYFNCTIFK